MLTLDEFLSRFSEVREESDGWVVPCPAHDDDHPSLRVAVSDANKILLKCRARCETRDVLAALGMSFRDLDRIAPGRVGVRATSRDVPAGPAEVAALAAQLDAWVRALWEEPGAVAALRYAHDRFGIGDEDARRLGLGYAKDLGGGPRLVVPFRDQEGVPRGYQARALDPKARIRWYGPKSPEGASWAKVAWLPGSAGWEEILVTEGPGDGLTACALGYDAIVVRGAGLASNPTVVTTIAEWAGSRPVVVAGDGDPSGRAFSSALSKALVERGVRVRVLDVPDGHDLTSWREQNPAAFDREMTRAVVEAKEVTTYDAVLRSRDESEYPLTDLGNARYVRDFIRAKGSDVRYSPEAGFFLVADGVWRHDTLDVTRAYVQEAAEQVAEIARELQIAAGSDSDSRKRQANRWTQWATYSQSRKGIDAAIRELQALRDVATDVNAFDQHPHLLACRNGVVDLRTGELLPSDPGLLLTRRVDLDYDPDAKCPRWEQFLQEVFPNHPELPAYVRRLVGYGITGETAEQCFAVLWGTGANGKSVFTDTLTEVFDELTVTTPFSTFEERSSGGIPNDLASLKGARLVMAAEGEQGRPMAEAVLKRVTGRDRIAARFMRREFFEFRPTFLLMLATNFKPKFRGQDEGLWRRVKLIPWERYFAPEERDHRLPEKLRKEAQGIFAWAVRGAREWYAQGLRDPDVIREGTREYREASDVLNGFVPGVFVPDPDGKVEAKTVFKAFQEYADEGNYLDLKKWSNRALYAALEERGYPRRRSTGGKFVIVGLRRARQTDMVPDHDQPESCVNSDGASGPVQVRKDTPITGPSLDDALG